MAAPLFDFSHLSPEERIELAELLWDSRPPSRSARMPSRSRSSGGDALP